MQTKSSMRRNNAAFEFMKSFIKGMIDKHRQDFDINELRDFIDYYLKLDISNKSDRLSGFLNIDVKFNLV